MFSIGGMSGQGEGGWQVKGMGMELTYDGTG